MNTMKTIICFLAVLFINLSAQNTNPVVTNVRFNETINPDGTVDIYYDVYDAEQSSVTIFLRVSKDEGLHYNFRVDSLSGDIGTNVTTGINKHIIWNFQSEYPAMWGVNTFKMRVIANDNTYGGSPCPGLDSVEYEGMTYHTVQIGEQCWLRENLNAGLMKYIGASLSNNGIIEKYCYNNLESNCTKYGGLYSWTEALNYQNGITNTTPPITPFVGNIQGICPAGWHIPSDEEYYQLSTIVKYLHTILDTNQYGYTSNTSGLALKFAGEIYDQRFLHLGTEGYYWTISVAPEFGNSYALCYSFWGATQTSNAAQFGVMAKSEGKSVRCIKD